MTQTNKVTRHRPLRTWKLFSKWPGVARIHSQLNQQVATRATWTCPSASQAMGEINPRILYIFRKFFYIFHYLRFVQTITAVKSTQTLTFSLSSTFHPSPASTTAARCPPPHSSAGCAPPDAACARCLRAAHHRCCIRCLHAARPRHLRLLPARCPLPTPAAPDGEC